MKKSQYGVNVPPNHIALWCVMDKDIEEKELLNIATDIEERVFNIDNISWFVESPDGTCYMVTVDGYDHEVMCTALELMDKIGVAQEEFNITINKN